MLTSKCFYVPVNQAVAISLTEIVPLPVSSCMMSFYIVCDFCFEDLSYRCLTDLFF